MESQEIFEGRGKNETNKKKHEYVKEETGHTRNKEDHRWS